MREASIRRRGTTVLELVAAAAVLAVLLVVCAQMLSRTAVQQRALANRRAALQMASNAMEHVHALPWDGLNEAATDAVATAVVGQEMVRGARLDVAVGEADATLRAKRIRVTVTWNEGSDEVERKQQLTAWCYAVATGNETDADPPKPSDLSGGTP